MPVPITRSERLDPEVRAWLERSDAENAPPIDTLSPSEARAQRNSSMRANAGEPDPLERVENFTIPGPAGEIPVRLYAAERGGLRPGLIYFHGGGFVVGSLDTHDALCRSIAKESGAAVLAVDYRLAPECKFPAAVDDASAATFWIASHAPQLGINPACLSLGGDSAGATLATVVALRCRDAGAPVLHSQILLYPVIDIGSFETPSYCELSEDYGLTRSAMQWFAAQYVASPADALHPEASPIRAPNLRGLPPALVITAEFDPLRDEGELYAERLRQAGVSVTVTRYPGMIHGFILMRGLLSAGCRAIRDIAAWMRSTAPGQDISSDPKGAATVS